jgi:hypothetical protein
MELTLLTVVSWVVISLSEAISILHGHHPHLVSEVSHREAHQLIYLT